MELGKEISSQERKAYSLLSDYYQYEDALNGQRLHEKTFQKLLAVEEKLLPALDRCDTLLILYEWLREMTRCNGYDRGDVASLCGWILERMEETAGESSGRLSQALSKTRKNLPGILVYLERIEKALRDYALEHGYPGEAFVLLYKVQEILDGVKRASSLAENLNGRLRPYMNLKRMVPEKFLTLLKVYFNTKRYRRSRKADQVGKSPLELLTGQKHEDFYGIVCGR